MNHLVKILLLVLLSCSESKAFILVKQSPTTIAKPAFFPSSSSVCLSPPCHLDNHQCRIHPFESTTSVFASNNNVDASSSSFSPPPSKEEEEEALLFPERLNIIYDSKCSVCRWEVEFLDSVQKLQQKHSSSTTTTLPFRFTDLEEDSYNPNYPPNGNITYAQGMKSFYAVQSDGTVLHGVPVFREAYGIVGLGWLWNWTVDVPWLGKIADGLYNVFARYRTDITRGSSVRELIRRYEEKQIKGEGEGSEEEVASCQKCEEKIAASQMTE